MSAVDVDLGDALRLSLVVGAAATALVLVPGVWLGRWLARSRAPWKGLVEVVVLLPLVLPPVVLGYALLVVFGRRGWVGGWLEQATGITLPFSTAGAVVAAAVVGFPLLVRQARLAFEAVDPGVEDAAATLGAGPVRRFTRVALPLAFPGVLAGALLCFARSLGEFGATITFAGNVAGETRTLAVAMWQDLQDPGGGDAVAPLAWTCVGVAVVAVGVGELLLRRGRTR